MTRVVGTRIVKYDVLCFTLQSQFCNLSLLIKWNRCGCFSVAATPNQSINQYSKCLHKDVFSTVQI